MDASIVSIGDELLTGDTINTNSAWLAARLTEHGVTVLQILVLPDDVELVSNELENVPGEIVFVTGGLGSTHDDITREAMALFVGIPLEENEEARAMLDEKKVPAEPARIMSRIPRGAEVLYNDVGDAPGFVIDDRFYVMPGVPAEMKDMFTSIKERFKGEPEEMEEVETGLPESSIAGLIRELAETFPDVKVGSYPGKEKVRIRMRSRNPMDLIRARMWLEEELDAYEASTDESMHPASMLNTDQDEDDGGELP